MRVMREEMSDLRGTVSVVDQNDELSAMVETLQRGTVLPGPLSTASIMKVMHFVRQSVR